MSRYAKAFENPQGPGDSRPTAMQVVEDEGLKGKLTDKVFLVTGVSSGIGIETLRALYATGAHVFGTVRNLEKGRKVVDEIEASTQGGKITLISMNLDDLASVKKGAEDFLRQSKTLNLIINNAGIMAVPHSQSKNGFESQFATCHLAHFYLFELLKDTLLRSATSAFPSRVVNVSSIGHRCAPPRTQDYQFTEAGSYDPWVSYGQAKTANIWFSNEIERRYRTRNLHSTSLHPGGIWTGLQDHLPDMRQAENDPVVKAYMMDVQQGAATQVYAGLSAEWKDQGGKYLSNLVEQKQRVDQNPMCLTDLGYAEWAFDPEKEKKLWKDSLKMVGLNDD